MKLLVAGTHQSCILDDSCFSDSLHELDLLKPHSWCTLNDWTDLDLGQKSIVNSVQISINFFLDSFHFVLVKYTNIDIEQCRDWFMVTDKELLMTSVGNLRNTILVSFP